MSEKFLFRISFFTRFCVVFHLLLLLVRLIFPNIFQTLYILRYVLKPPLLGVNTTVNIWNVFAFRLLCEKSHIFLRTKWRHLPVIVSPFIKQMADGVVVLRRILFIRCSDLQQLLCHNGLPLVYEIKCGVSYATHGNNAVYCVTKQSN
jgi:hypothetical protein